MWVHLGAAAPRCPLCPVLGVTQGHIFQVMLWDPSPLPCCSQRLQPMCWC